MAAEQKANPTKPPEKRSRSGYVDISGPSVLPSTCRDNAVTAVELSSIMLVPIVRITVACAPRRPMVHVCI